MAFSIGRLACAAVVALGLQAGAAVAQDAGTSAMVATLQRGGFILVMRHAQSPNEPPTAETAGAGNTKRERQLDETGKRTAVAMGAALKKLKIPVGEVLTSPTYRAQETARALEMGAAKPVPQLGESAQGMQGADRKRVAWLKAATAKAPPTGTNRLIITHAPAMAAAYGVPAEGISDGETLIVQPLGKDSRVVARVKIESWPDMK